MLQAHQPAASSRRIVIMGCGVVAAAIAIALSDQGHIVSILDRHRESFDRLPSGKTQAGEIVPAFQVLDAVQSGSVELGHSAGYYYLGKNPALTECCCWLASEGHKLLLQIHDFVVPELPVGFFLIVRRRSARRPLRR